MCKISRYMCIHLKVLLASLNECDIKTSKEQILLEGSRHLSYKGGQKQFLGVKYYLKVETFLRIRLKSMGVAAINTWQSVGLLPKPDKAILFT